MNVVGATPLSSTYAGYCFAVGRTTYMVIADPRTISRLSGMMAEHLYDLGYGQTAVDDDRRGSATVDIGGEYGLVTGPGNAIAAIRRKLGL